MNSSEHERRLEAIRNFKPSEEYIQKLKEWCKGYDEYMKQEVHEGNCHCARCMSEFMEIKNGN